MESVYFKLDKKTLDELRLIAEKENRKVSNLVAYVMKKFVEENKLKEK